VLVRGHGLVADATAPAGAVDPHARVAPLHASGKSAVR
jgi:hypothetical protein